MEQLIFVAIIVIFSILDSVARTKKKRQQAGGVPPKPKAPRGWGEWETEEDDAGDTYDSEPSYDDVQVGRTPEEADPPPRYTQPYGSTGASTGTGSKGSEGMIPSDIWEEIAGLATGRAPAPKRAPPEPKRAPPEPVRTSSLPSRRAPARPVARTPSRPVEVERGPARPVESHGIHRAHAGFGTDPSSRARSREDGLDPLAHELGVDAASARRQLLSRNRHALRQAVILQEVLGPPAALREDPLGE